MNVHELPMILFTVIGQMSVGAFWALGALHLYGHYRHMSPSSVDRVTTTAMYAAGPLLVLGFFAAFFHLGDPFHALNTLRHIGSSWQSREIASGILYGITGFAFAFSQWFTLFTRRVRQVLAGLTALSGFLLVLTMAGTYYSVQTIPAWHHPATWIFFFCSAILTGSLAVAVALLITWNLQTHHTTGAAGGTGETTSASSTTTGGTKTSAATAAGTTGASVKTAPATVTTSASTTSASTISASTASGGVWGVVSRLGLVSDQPMSVEVNQFTTRALAGLSLSAALAGLVILVTYPVYLLDLAGGPEAGREVAERLLMPSSYVRWVLLAVVIVLAGVFAFLRAHTSETPSKALAWIIVGAFVLAVITELLGRGMHYEGLWHVGLNTSQTLLGH